MDGSHSLLSPIRAPTELAEERSAISTDLSDAISSVQKQDSPVELNGSSLRPLCQSVKESPTVEAQDSPEELFITQALNDLKNLIYFGIFRKKLLKFRRIFIKICEFWTASWKKSVKF